MSAKDGGPAFPRPASEDTSSGTLADGNDIEAAQRGMTLRDYFAAAALTGLCASDSTLIAGDAADMAYNRADAMLATREAK